MGHGSGFSLPPQDLWAYIQQWSRWLMESQPGVISTQQAPALLLGLSPGQQELSLSGHALSSAPSQLWDAHWLVRLDLSRCSLAALPPQIQQLQSLEALNLMANALESLPPQIGSLQHLKDLNLAFNLLTALPSELGRLTRLVYLNVMANRLECLPDELGCLSALYRLGLKSNRLTALPATIGKLHSLVELFLTDNLLESLPEELGSCSRLVKLQASFNRLASLPPQLASLPRLELMRVAVNCLPEVPRELAGCPSLAWMSLGGNAACAVAPPPRSQIRAVAMDAMEMGKPLGSGASGDVFAATLDGQDVAVKVFKGETSPDGQAADEIAVTCHVDHPNLTRVLAMVEQPHALVLDRVFGEPLAQKPNLQVLLRCRWAAGVRFPQATVARIGAGVASALAYMHEHCICHGDVYAHNIVVDASGKATLLDYGASFFYKPDTLPHEAQEVRAFGLFLSDLLARMDGGAHGGAARQKLEDTARACLDCDPLKRPAFAAVAAALGSG